MRHGPSRRDVRATTGPAGAYDSFFLVVNPSAVDIQVRATFATEDGTGVTTTVTVPANTRANIWPAVIGDPSRPGVRVCCRADALRCSSKAWAEQPFVAERAMYWNEFVGGHANAGTPWSGTFSTPAQAPADVQGDEHDAAVGALVRRDRRDHSRAELRPVAGGRSRRTVCR